MRKIDLDKKQLPDEVAPAVYTPHWEFDNDAPAIPASIVEIQDVTDETDEFLVTATFPGHSEPADVCSCLIGLDGEQCDNVQIWIDDEHKFDEQFLNGVLKGVFEALIQTHRNVLDKLRVNVAHREKITLKPAGELDYLATITVKRTEIFAVPISSGSPEKARAIATKVGAELGSRLRSPDLPRYIEVPEQYWAKAGEPEVHPKLKVFHKSTLSYEYSVDVKPLSKEAAAAQVSTVAATEGDSGAAKNEDAG